jgi:hypothetical protein
MPGIQMPFPAASPCGGYKVLHQNWLNYYGKFGIQNPVTFVTIRERRSLIQALLQDGPLSPAGTPREYGDPDLIGSIVWI